MRKRLVKVQCLLGSRLISDDVKVQTSVFIQRIEGCNMLLPFNSEEKMGNYSLTYFSIHQRTEV